MLTHGQEVVDLYSDQGSQDTQVFLKLSAGHLVLEVLVSVTSKHHLLILWQKLPHPSTYLSEETRGRRRKMRGRYVVTFKVAVWRQSPVTLFKFSI